MLCKRADINMQDYVLQNILNFSGCSRNRKQEKKKIAEISEKSPQTSIAKLLQKKGE